MPESYNPRYYTLDIIPKHWLEYIDVRINWLIKVFDISPASWPIDCVKIIKKIAAVQKVPFTYGFVEMPDKVDALAKLEHCPGFNPGVYIVQINKNKVRYPYVTSKDRRANFTIAHELAHIALGHLFVPWGCKTPLERFIENTAADEFAGRFLMPKSLVLNANLNPINASAKHFIVSHQALWKRLNNLKRLDLLSSSSFIVCNTCGNRHISPIADYCCICGCQLNDIGNGVSTFNYADGHNLDNDARIIQCLVCSNEEISSTAQFCRICGLPLFNYCTKWYFKICCHKNAGNARFCELCGSRTLFYERSWLLDWQQAKNTYFAENGPDYLFNSNP